MNVSRVIETITKIQQTQTISLETFRRLMEQMGLTVARYVTDANTLRAIEQDWGNIRIDAGREPHR